MVIRMTIKFRPKTFHFLAPALCLLLMVMMMESGCALPSYRMHPAFEEKLKSMGSSWVISPDVRVYELIPGGMTELRDDWCAVSERNILDAFLKGMSRRNYRVKPLRLERDIAGEMEDIETLYRVVDKSIRLHAYGPQLFPEKQKHFEYSIGSIKGILRQFDADAILFVSAFYRVSGDDPVTYISAAVADASGTIVWYDVKGSHGEHDLRDARSAQNLADEILSDLPVAGG